LFFCLDKQLETVGGTSSVDLSYDFDKEQSAATKKFLVGIPYKSLFNFFWLELGTAQKKLMGQ
jgi:hypothetical protein